MIQNSSSEIEQTCIIQRYSPAWALGTGLRVSLPAGEYRITGENFVQGVRYFRLEGIYRIDSCLCATGQTTSPQSTITVLEEHEPGRVKTVPPNTGGISNQFEISLSI